MPLTDLYNYAVSVLGMDPTELATEGISPGSSQINIPDTPAGTIATAGINTNASSVNSILQGVLQLYGINGAAAQQYAQQFIIDHPSVTEAGAQAQLQLDLMDPHSQIGAVVDQMYPEIAQRRAQSPNAPPVSISDVVGLRQQYAQDVNDAGLSPYVDSLALAQKAIAGDSSPKEVQDRIAAAQQAVYAEPPETRAELTRMFGVGNSVGAATAYFLDPTNSVPVIQQQLQAAQIGGAATRTGFGLLTSDEATRLAQQGVTESQAQSGLNALGKESELFNPLPGEQGQSINQDQQLAAQFEGNVTDQQLIERRRQARQAVFGGGGQFNAGSKGVTGLGSAATG